MIQIYTLGALQVVRDAEHSEPHVVTERDWHTRQARQLLKILITERPQPVSTDRLIELLWPTSEPDAAATTLRSAINALRNVLEPERRSRAPSKYIITQTPGYAFRHHAEIWLDVAEFERLLDSITPTTAPNERHKILASAVALYRDDYLTSDTYADWAQVERERLRERYFSALLALADLQAAAHEYTAAIAACRRVIARDPVRESAYQALMRYQAESGDSAAALLTYERCRALLAEELGADPSPLTQSWHQRILNGEISVPSMSNTPSTVTSNGERKGAREEHGQEQPTTTEQVPETLVLPPQTLSSQHLSQSFSPHLSSADQTYFVGREQELALLTARLQQAQAGHGSLLLIEGEAGVGKTHLVHRLLQQAMDGQITAELTGKAAGTSTNSGVAGGAEQAEVTIIHATCQPLEQQLPFAPLSDGLGRFLHSLPDAILHALPVASLAQFAQLTPSLQDRLPSLPVLPIEAWSNSDENRQRLINGLIAILSTLATARPLVLFLDDLHWADAETLAVLGRLAQRLSSLPILVLLAYRAADLDANEPLATLLYSLHPTLYTPATASQTVTASTRRGEQPHLLVVQRFVEQEIASLLEQLADQKVARDAQLVTMLCETTRGNPLFVTEALRALQERQRSLPELTWHKLLQPTTSPSMTQSAGTEPTGTHPSTHPEQTFIAEIEAALRLGQNPRVQEVSLERIRRLPPAPRQLLQLCAVIGRDFSLDLLEQVAPDDTENDLVINLELLLQRRFLLERPDERIDFGHEILRQVTYEQMSALQRRRLHRRVADALASSRRAQEIPGDIVFHYRQSGGGVEHLIAEYCVRAGERLLHTYGFRQAVTYFEDALALLHWEQPQQEREERAVWIQRALLGRGLAYESLFDPEGVTTSYRELQQWAAARQEHPVLLMAISRQTSMLALLGQQRESNELLQELINTLTAADSGAFGDEALRHQGTAVMLDLFKRRQQIFPTPAAALATSDTDDVTDDREAEPPLWAPYTPPPPVETDPVAAILAALPPVHAVLPLLDYGWTLLIQGQLPEAVHCLTTVVELAQQTDQPSIAVIAYHQLAVAARIRGDLPTCYALNEQSLAYQRKLQQRAGELVSIWPRIGSSFVALQMGALDEAEQRLLRVISVLEGVESFRNHRNSATIGLGLVALARGDLVEAEAKLQATLTDAEHLYPYIHVQALLGLAKIADQRSAPTEAEQHLQRALRFSGARSLLDEYVETLLVMAEIGTDEVPTAKLIAAMVDYVSALGIDSLVEKLQRNGL